MSLVDQCAIHAQGVYKKADDAATLANSHHRMNVELRDRFDTVTQLLTEVRDSFTAKTRAAPSPQAWHEAQGQSRQAVTFKRKSPRRDDPCADANDPWLSAGSQAVGQDGPKCKRSKRTEAEQRANIRVAEATTKQWLGDEHSGLGTPETSPM